MIAFDKIRTPIEVANGMATGSSVASALAKGCICIFENKQFKNYPGGLNLLL